MHLIPKILHLQHEISNPINRGGAIVLGVNNVAELDTPRKLVGRSTTNQQIGSLDQHKTKKLEEMQQLQN